MNINTSNRALALSDLDNLTRYFNDIRQYEPLTREEERELILRIQRGDDSFALEKLIKCNMRFVVSVAKNYQGQGVSLLDLISQGNIGLVEAAKRFDPKMDNKFYSYAVHWIRMRIFTAMDFNKRLIQLPANRELLVLKVRKQIIELEQQLGRYPSMEELAKHLNDEYTIDELNEAILHGGRIKSLNEPIGDEDDAATLEDVTSGDLSIDDTNRAVSIIEDLNRFLFHLTQYEYDILVLSLGLNKEPIVRNKDIAKALKLKENDIANIKVRAIKRLRKVKNISSLKDYLQ